MDDVTFKNPTFDPDRPGVDDDFDLPDPPMEPPFDVQQQLNASGDNLQDAGGEERQNLRPRRSALLTVSTTK